MKDSIWSTPLAGLLLIATSSGATKNIMAQTNHSEAARWWSAAKVAPDFESPRSRRAWEKKRKEIRAQLWQLLGKLPARPATPKVQTVFREDRGDYVVEKFQFDNSAGAIVPGYLLLPKQTPGKSPAILYCHWRIIYPGVGHVYLPDMWARMLSWMDENLLKK